MNANQIIKVLKGYSRLLITSHVGLEGDALGSELALASLLRKLGKTVYIVNSDPVPINYRFLPGTRHIRSQLHNRAYQAVLIIDCTDKRRIGLLAKKIGKDKPVINIDHHIDNKTFGQINWVNPQASSAGEMIYHLFKMARIKLSKEDALNLYVAILTDTGSFRHCNTTSATFYICSQLLKSGINPTKIYNRIYENNSVQQMALLAKIISRINFAANNQIAWVEIKKPEFKLIKNNPEITNRILDFARSTNTVKVAIIFFQAGEGLIKLSLRSRSPINVQKIASLFGGGGHRFASGCTVKGGLKRVEQIILKEVNRRLSPRH